MLNNNIKNDSSCEFAEQIVSFLYKEADAPDKAVLNAHVKTCMSCAEELSGFTAVRSSVLQWREAEFDLLPNPFIDIPFEKSQNLPVRIKTSETSASWFGEIRKLFTLSSAPAWTAASAFAAVIIFGGLFLFSNRSTENLEIAGNENKNVIKTIVPASEKAEIQPADAVSDKKLDTTSPAIKSKSTNKAEVKAAERISETKIEPKPLMTKVSNNFGILRKESDNSVSVQKVKSVIRSKNLLNAQARQVPKLNDLAEDEDESLRLADLFDDADTR